MICCKSSSSLLIMSSLRNSIIRRIRIRVPSSSSICKQREKSLSFSSKTPNNNTDNVLSSTSSSSTSSSKLLLQTDNDLIRIVENYNIPLDEVVYAFGYGSGVLNQSQQQQQSSNVNNNNSTNVIDMIFVVKDSYRFHCINYQMNSNHYSHFVQRHRPQHNNDAAISTTTTAAASRINYIQRHDVPYILSNYLSNPHVYFNVVPSSQNSNMPSIKYGVVHIDDINNDLQNWKYLYIAGRLHKPVVSFINTTSNNNSHDQISSQLLYQEQYNLPAALSTSLLLHLLSTSTSNEQQQQEHGTIIDDQTLFYYITQLSYMGDIRMKYNAEDPNKIHKLISGDDHINRYWNLYSSHIEALQQQGILSITPTPNVNGRHTLTWDSNNPVAREHLWNNIPTYVHDIVIKKQHQLNHNNTNTGGSNEHTNKLIALKDTISNIVSKSSQYQSMKGIITAGIKQSFQYVIRKLMKGRGGNKKTMSPSSSSLTMKT